MYRLLLLTFASRTCRSLFAQVLPVLLPNVQKAPAKDRKIVAVGLSNLLAKSNTMLSEPSIRAW